MGERYQDLLALLIICNKNFADAYQLCKVLSWKFDVINCSEIIKRLEEKAYVTSIYPKSNTLKFFSLTPEGKRTLREEIEALNKVLKDEFPEEIDFVDKLFSYE